MIGEDRARAGSGGRSSRRRSSTPERPRRTRARSACVSRVCSAGCELLGADLEAACSCRSPPCSPRPWIDASPCPIVGACVRTSSSEAGSRRRERDLRAALEVDAEVEALDAIAPSESSRSATPEIANQMLRRPTTSIRCHPAVSPLAPMKRGLSNHLKPASRPSIARVAATAVTSEITVPIRSISAKPFTPAVATANSTERRDRRDDVRVDDRLEALRVAGRDRGAHGLARARLLLDAFEDDDVRVGRDADREDQAGEARQRQRDVEEQDRAVEKRGVDGEPDDGDDAEEAVEDEQEEHDDEQAGDRRASRPGSSESLPSVAEIACLLERRERDGQGAGLEHERQVLRLLQRRRCP